jgi:hypothetical protein
MTLLGVLDLDDRMLFAGDRLIIDNNTPLNELPLTQDTDKLRRLEQQPSLIWGFSGEVPIGRDFGKWIAQQKFASWKQLRAECLGALAPLNGRARELAMLSRTEKTFEGCEILIGGWIGKERGLLNLDNERGDHEPSTDPSFYGFAKPAAQIAWLVLEATSGARDDREVAFRRVMDIAVKRVLSLDGPVQYEYVSASP